MEPKYEVEPCELGARVAVQAAECLCMFEDKDERQVTYKCRYQLKPGTN